MPTEKFSISPYGWKRGSIVLTSHKQQHSSPPALSSSVEVWRQALASRQRYFAASMRALRLGNRQPVDLGALPAGDLACPRARRDVLQGSYCYSCTASTSNSWDGVLATS